MVVRIIYYSWWKLQITGVAVWFVIFVLIALFNTKSCLLQVTKILLQSKICKKPFLRLSIYVTDSFSFQHSCTGQFLSYWCKNAGVLTFKINLGNFHSEGYKHVNHLNITNTGLMYFNLPIMYAVFLKVVLLEVHLRFYATIFFCLLVLVTNE